MNTRDVSKRGMSLFVVQKKKSRWKAATEGEAGEGLQVFHCALISAR